MIRLIETIRALRDEYAGEFGFERGQARYDLLLGTAALLVGLVSIVALVALIGGGR